MIRAVSVRASRHLQRLLSGAVIIPCMRTRAERGEFVDKIRIFERGAVVVVVVVAWHGFATSRGILKSENARADEKKRASGRNSYLSSEIMRYRKPIFNYRPLKTDKPGYHDFRIQRRESSRGPRYREYLRRWQGQRGREGGRPLFGLMYAIYFPSYHTLGHVSNFTFSRDLSTVTRARRKRCHKNIKLLFQRLRRLLSRWIGDMHLRTADM